MDRHPVEHGGGRLMAVAYVLLAAEAGREREVYDRLLAVPEVRDPMALFGEYDLICKIDAADLDALGQAILVGLRGIPGVVHTRTLMTTKL
jgi:DNA-binding Lrp family transcriptional regulator